jgi:hypothetical protein
MKPYRYEEAVDLWRTIVDDLAILAGDKVGPSGVSWQDIAGTLSVNLLCLASRLDAAREGRVVNGPVVFPSPSDISEES